MIDRDEIKRMAKERGVSFKDMIALADKNDPFCIGSKTHIEKAKWFAKVYRDMGSPANVHIRRVHYALVARADVEKPPDRSGRKKEVDGLLYENTENDWNMLENASKWARYLGLVPMGNFVDRRNPDPTINAKYYGHDNLGYELSNLSISDAIYSLAASFNQTYNPQLCQAYHLEVWCEKSTMNDVIMPVARRYSANVVTGLGEMSITAVRDLFSRIREAGKPTRVFYISDFDPAGECMPVSVARKIEYFLRKHESERDVKLRQLMLNRDQCIQYELPRTPIKDSDRRKEGFEARHGAGATELDALEALYPGEMESLLKEALDPYFDKGIQQAIKSENWRLYNAVWNLLEDRLSGLADDILSEARYIDQGFEIPEAGLIDDTDGDWILDSGLSYIEQLSRYEASKEGVNVA